MLKFMKAGQEMAMSYGYTTAQEGRAMENHELLAGLAETGFLKIDVVSYIDYLFTNIWKRNGTVKIILIITGSVGKSNTRRFTAG
ncbi:MAG: hypothetical protein R3A12_01925 [Ignavibacteria bacterium]